MALNAGDNGCTSGLSARIYNAWTADPNNGFSSPLTTGQALTVKSLCYAIASSVVAEINANARVQIQTTDVGLQRDNTAGNPDTLGPSRTILLPAGCVK